MRTSTSTPGTRTRALSCAQGKAKPPGISAVPGTDIYVADDVHNPNRCPRPKCSVRTAYGNFQFAGSAEPSELLRCPAHDSGAYPPSPSSLASPSLLVTRCLDVQTELATSPSPQIVGLPADSRECFEFSSGVRTSRCGHTVPRAAHAVAVTVNGPLPSRSRATDPRRAVASSSSRCT